MAALPEKSPTQLKSVRTIHNYLAEEIQRARKQLSPDQWQTILVGVSDEGAIAAYPCRLILPFHYPATIEELDESEQAHFSFPDSSWELRRQVIPEFAEQYELFAAMEDEAESIPASQRHLQRRIAVLQDACLSFDPALTIFGIESDSETWWEVTTFHISGPRIPPPLPPVSDVQILARLSRQTHSGLGLGKSGFEIERGAITEMSFDGANTTDAMIDLLRGIPNLNHLLRNLKMMSLQYTLVTNRSLKFLEKELPHVEIAHSHYLEI